MSHLAEYLLYYQALKSPNFAVMVTGEWGTGKTFQVRRVLNEDNSIYVSLFGISSKEEIHLSVLAQADPTAFRAKKIFGGGSDLFKEIGGLHRIAGLPLQWINNAVRDKIGDKKVIVFDDLERSTLNLKEVLGAINHYVEHEGCKVLIVAHDEKIENEINTQKEKLIGQSIKIMPETKDAFDAFLTQLESSEVKSFLSDYVDDIVNTFISSEVKSLRVLRHVIFDIARLYSSFEERHLSNRQSIQRFLQYFCAFDIAVRAGSLSRRDILEKTQIYTDHHVCHRDDTNAPTHNIITVGERHSNIIFEDYIDPEFLIEMLFDGKYSKDNIRKSLNSRQLFIDPGKAQPWQTVMNFDVIDDESVKSAVEEMTLQLRSKKEVPPGELLHIFSLKLLMAEIGYLDATLSD